MTYNSQLYEETLNRSKFFQTVHAWPLLEELNYIGWLGNFDEGEERDIACEILDFFTYYSKNMIDQMFDTAVSKAGFIFSKHFIDWQHTDFKNRCYYSFIPGETQNPTDSGHIFLRKLRDVLDIPETQIKNYNELPSILKESGPSIPLILVDDFVGSGAQVWKAWSNNTFPNGKTLAKICEDGGHCAVYSPLIVNEKGSNVISNHCNGLNLCCAHILGPEYCLFEKECICWKNDEDLFKKGTDLILKKSKLLGIPSTDGKHVNDEQGFGKQGLALSFDHGAPDAIPAFFYWIADNWTPLISKKYNR